MTRKKEIRLKEPVKVRFRRLADGSESVYLDIYNDGRRQYEFLKLYIIPVRTPADKVQNETTMRVANAIKAQRILDIANDRAGIKRQSKILLSEYMRRYVAERNNAANGIRQAAAILDAYNNKNVKLCSVDKSFCRGFIAYLRDHYRKADGKPLKANTVRKYISIIETAFNTAVRHEVISVNPFCQLEREDMVKGVPSVRQYLSIDELRRMIETPCRNSAVKSAYLFSCFCGLRLSDVERLRWSNIVEENGVKWLDIDMQKTKAHLHLPLSDAAVGCLPIPRGNDDAGVFNLPSRTPIRHALALWAAAAGVKKNITFHTSRHTCATALLTKGADIYTVSKILGHTDVSTTQIYAKIVDSKKIEAVNLLNKL